MIPQPNRDGSWAKAQILQRVQRPARGFQASGKRSDHQGCACCHFAWAGSPAPGSPHYFRIHGPAALVEYDNTQNGANHVHPVWIDPQGVFGRDLLKAHYQDAH